MKAPVVMIGVGEMGGVFARGMLRDGRPVVPVLRGMDLAQVAAQLAEQGSTPEVVLITVGEADLPAVLRDVPTAWCDRLILLQNELLPDDWRSQGIAAPTVISVWFEKKPGRDFKQIIPSPVHGPHAALVCEGLATLGIDCLEVDEARLLFELVRKNVYILTTNIAGLRVGGTVAELWENHSALAREVANEVMDIQFRLLGQTLDREALIDAMVEAFEGDLQHKCMGRSAPMRLARALEHADKMGLTVPLLRELSAETAN